MRTRTLLSPAIAAAVAAWLSWTAPQAAAPGQGGPARAVSAGDAAAHRASLDTYCVTCHNQRLKTGGLALDAMDLSRVPADAAIWERVIRKVRTGVMPPAGMPRPDAATRDGLVAWLEGTIDRNGRAVSRPSLDPSPEPRRVRQRGSRPAVARRRRRGASAARRAGLRLRQHRRDAGRLAGAARALRCRGGRDRHARCRRRLGRRRRGARVSRRGRSLAGQAQRGPAARHERRHGGRHPRCRSTAST